MNFKAIVEYNGSRYSGWQDQKNAHTVMGELRKAAHTVFGVDVEMQGAGRTDAGVHALGQVLHMKVPVPFRGSMAMLKQRLNEELPGDIAILEVEQAPPRFHARHDAASRTYLYQISKRKQAFTKKYVWWVKQELDVEAMKRAAGMLRGRHDFVCFRARDPARPEESTIVVVERAEIEAEDDIIQFRIEASHFLWKMVRRIVGVLVKVGSGEVSETEFHALVDGMSNPKLDVAAWTAPASGLFLEAVRYVVSAEKAEPPGKRRHSSPRHRTR
jgi:tRNA pseudouridine38-40 synthase